MSARSSSISSDLLRRMPEDDSTANKATSERPVRPRIVFPGGGIFFWWQAGAVKALQEMYKLEHYDFAGASAGSLSAVFCACQVRRRMHTFNQSLYIAKVSKSRVGLPCFVHVRLIWNMSFAWHIASLRKIRCGNVMRD